jgi:hypothetical protein
MTKLLLMLLLLLLLMMMMMLLLLLPLPPPPPQLTMAQSVPIMQNTQRNKKLIKFSRCVTFDSARTRGAAPNM